MAALCKQVSTALQKHNFENVLYWACVIGKHLNSDEVQIGSLEATFAFSQTERRY